MKKKFTGNEGLIRMLADSKGEAKLRSVALCLNRRMMTINVDGTEKNPTVNLLDMVSYGVNRPVSFRKIYELMFRNIKPR